MIAVLTPEPVLTRPAARAYTGMVLKATAEQASALGWRIGKCRRTKVGAECAFSMRMNGSTTCYGLVRLRVRSGLEYGFARVVCG